MCRGPPSAEQQRALQIIQKFTLCKYRQSLCRDALHFLRETHGTKWGEKLRKGNKHTKEDVEAIRDILWQVAENDWFEYPSGSQLIFFRFPQMYQLQAKQGVRVMFTQKGPMARRRQSPLGPDEKEVLRAKIRKFIERKYIAPPTGWIKSLIKYFAVPKGPDDWRIVFHAGANKLNDSVWTPSFSLPNLNSLLRIVDENSLMQDMDIGKMFLNFQLHPSTMMYAAVDLGPLDLNPTECSHRWMCWTQNLMGFRSSPYNSIRMYLIAEEIIWGDRHDTTNAFQWSYIRLNLLGTKDYQPSEAWLSKRRADGSLASDYACFVDNKRVAGQGRARVIEAGHAISTREAWLGIQDALRKLRCWGGLPRPGAWAGASVCIEEDAGVVVLTSMDKWMHMKNICRHWLDLLNEGANLLDFKQLRSDRGFMVYVTQVYPGLKHLI